MRRSRRARRAARRTLRPGPRAPQWTHAARAARVPGWGLELLECLGHAVAEVTDADCLTFAASSLRTEPLDGPSRGVRFRLGLWAVLGSRTVDSRAVDSCFRLE
eukprot:scaffold127408_cov63-Phaeocystis_antarctica.AAC.4